MEKIKISFGKQPVDDNLRESMEDDSKDSSYQTMEKEHVELIKQAIQALDSNDIETAKKLLQQFLPQEEAEIDEKPDFKSKISETFKKYDK